jgi:universal stress protein E
MRAIRRILVAVKDPTAKSLPAVDKGAQLARAHGAALELFHGICTPLYVNAFGKQNPHIEDLETQWRDRLSTDLEAVAARVRKQGIEVSSCVQWDFPAHEAVLRRASRIKADLIVVERHEGRHIAASFLHLTDWELLRMSPVPVLIVKSSSPYRNPVILAAIDPTHAFSKPGNLDGEILKLAHSFKAAMRGTLHAVHAYVPLPPGVKPSDYLKPDLAKRLDAQVKGAVQKRFDREVRLAGIPTARCHLVAEHPIDAIPKIVRHTGSAIVVMGAISRSGIKQLFIGNTAEAVLDKLGCDVLIVKPPRFKNKVGRESRGTRIIAAQPIV